MRSPLRLRLAPTLWRIAVSIAIFLIARSHVAAQGLNPFMQFGAGTSTLEGTSFTGGLGLEWHGFRILAQHWGSRQWGNRVRNHPSPCALFSIGSETLRFNDHYNETSLQLGYRLKFLHVLRAGAHVGVGHYIYRNQTMHRELRTCTYPLFGGTADYIHFSVTSWTRQRYSLSTQASLGVAIDPQAEILVTGLLSYAKARPASGEPQDLQYGITLQVVGYF